uniref:BTB domain-containing protein n=1 Tax=Phaeomonas parva TaxID=124430 RepID=A0A7S1UE26_9STRA|mmetsp:Transcript_43824/g.137674  ORF Transcript_43824/g.137674 Transcript_43824/m.137674 type:complete len:1516 (+) Transcript_43824:152-4699(+)
MASGAAEDPADPEDVERVWGDEVPDEAPRVASLRAMLRGRQELDMMLSQCVAEKGKGAPSAAPLAYYEYGQAIPARLRRMLKHAVERCREKAAEGEATTAGLSGAVTDFLAGLPEDHFLPYALVSPRALAVSGSNTAVASIAVAEQILAKRVADFAVEVSGERRSSTVQCRPCEGILQDKDQFGVVEKDDPTPEELGRSRVECFYMDLVEAFCRLDRCMPRRRAQERASQTIFHLATILEASREAAGASILELVDEPAADVDDDADAGASRREHLGETVRLVGTKGDAANILINVQVGLRAWAGSCFGVGAVIHVGHAFHMSRNEGSAERGGGGSGEGNKSLLGRIQDRMGSRRRRREGQGAATGTVRLFGWHIEVLPLHDDTADDAFADVDGLTDEEGSGADSPVAAAATRMGFSGSSDQEDFDANTKGLRLELLKDKNAAGDGGASAAAATDAAPSSELEVTTKVEKLVEEGVDAAGVARPLRRNAEDARYLATSLWSWGRNDFGCLGLGVETGLSEPRRVPWPPKLALPLEPVLQIACSSRHSVIVTAFGGVFTCGDGTDGALGTGEAFSSGEFVPVSWSAVTGDPEEDADADDDEAPSRLAIENEASNRSANPTIIQVAAGADILGTHSAAVDEFGRLYTWGKGAATGHGVVSAVLAPKEVTRRVDKALELVRDASQSRRLKHERSEDARKDADAISADARVAKVACGGMFTACVTVSGALLTWGSFSKGRLGYPAKTLTTKDGSVLAARRERKRKERFQLTPRVVKSERFFVDVACGDAHAVSVDRDGALWGWGRNDAGQVGLAALRADGALQPEVSAPISIAPFSEGVLDPQQRQRAKFVACGYDHTAAVDAEGVLWTWGARGAACLGHGDEFDTFATSVANAALPVKEKRTRIAVQAAALGEPVNLGIGPSESVTATHEVPMSCTMYRWTSPRPVEALRGTKIKDVSLGDRVTGVLTKAPRNGAVYLCGEGPSVLRVDKLRSASDKWQQEDIGAKAKGGAKPLKDEKQWQALSDVLAPVGVPRMLCAPWSLKEIAESQAFCFSCSGQRVMIGASCEQAAAGLGGQLWRSVSTFSYKGGLGDIDFEDEPLRPDCILVASGGTHYAHRVVLAQRSQVLRDLILEEELVLEDDDDQPFVEVFLPGLQVETLRYLLHYLYNDTLPTEFASTVLSSIPANLREVASKCGLKDLAEICDRVIAMGDPQSQQETLEQDGSLVEDARDGNRNQFHLKPTFALDLGAFVGEPAWADVILLAEGRQIYAHSLLLAARSEYFNGLFGGPFSPFGRGGGLLTTGTGSGLQPIEIELPGKYITLLRLVTYMYTGKLPKAPVALMLDDLMSADRYGVLDLLELVQSMIDIDDTNVGAILALTSSLTGAKRLKEDALRYAIRNLGDVSTQPGFMTEIILKDPEARESIFSRARGLLGPAQSALYDYSKKEDYNEQQVLEARQKEQEKRSGFPWLPVAALAVVYSLYRLVFDMYEITVIGPFVPILNAVVTAVVMYMVYKRIKD